MDLLLERSPITGFAYYTTQYGVEYTLWVKLDGRKPDTVRSAAINEIPVGLLAGYLRQRGVKGSATPLNGQPVNGFLAVATFSGKGKSGPGLHLRCQ